MRNRGAVPGLRDKSVFYQSTGAPSAAPPAGERPLRRDGSANRPGCAATLGILLLLLALVVAGAIVFALLMDYSPADLAVATGESRQTDTFEYTVPGDWQVVDDGIDFADVASTDRVRNHAADDGNFGELQPGEFYVEMTYHIFVLSVDPAAYLTERKADTEDAGADYAEINDETVLGISGPVARMVGTIEREAQNVELGSVMLAFDFQAGLFVMVGLSDRGEEEALEDYMLAIARTVEPR